MTYEDAITLAKYRSDCDAACIDALIGFVRDTRDVEGDIVEAGSYKCGATIAIAATSPEKTVYAFDVFGGLPYGEDQRGFENFATNDYKEVLDAIHPFPNIMTIVGTHEETIPVFANWREPLSLIFLDSDFYSSHKVVLEKLYPLLSSGGRIVFHDWYFDGVQQAVREVLGNAPNHYEVPNTKMGVIHKI